ncbi:MAG: hypothetical protein JWO58_2147 [Chitinophagaceae bacterium]|nr:hypothetical protein [Chitinophagaceae bacterium]
MSVTPSFYYLLISLTLSFQGVAQHYTFAFTNARNRQPINDIKVNVNLGIADYADPSLVYHPKKRIYSYTRHSHHHTPLKISIFPPDYYFPGVNIGGAIILHEDYSSVYDFHLEVLPTIKINLVKKESDIIVIGVKVPNTSCDDIEKKLYLHNIKQYDQWSCYPLDNNWSALSFTMDESNQVLYAVLEDCIYLDLFFTDETIREEKIKINRDTKEVTIVINHDYSSLLVK